MLFNGKNFILVMILSVVSVVNPVWAGADESATGSITTKMIADDAVTTDKILGNAGRGIRYLMSDNYGTVFWGKLVSESVTAPTAPVINSVASDKVADNAITTKAVVDGAITREKTEGVVGVVPVGDDKNPTSYATFWLAD